MTVATSTDGESWQTLGEIANDAPFEALGTLSLPAEVKAQYVKVEVTLADGYSRMLLGELELIGPDRIPSQAGARGTGGTAAHARKKLLDDALIAAGVKYLYSSMVTDVLRDASGNLCGIVMANRAGRQAVIARQVIDATGHATAARLAGAEFSGADQSVQTVRRVVIGGEPHAQPGRGCATTVPPVHAALSQ